MMAAWRFRGLPMLGSARCATASPELSARRRAPARPSLRGATAAGWLICGVVTPTWDGAGGWDARSLVQPYSVSKPFAAVCALRLVEAGRLELDAPVQRYWPGFQAPAAARSPCAAAGSRTRHCPWLLRAQRPPHALRPLQVPGHVHRLRGGRSRVQGSRRAAPETVRHKVDPGRGHRHPDTAVLGSQRPMARDPDPAQQEHRRRPEPDLVTPSPTRPQGQAGLLASHLLSCPTPAGRVADGGVVWGGVELSRGRLPGEGKEVAARLAQPSAHRGPV